MAQKARKINSLSIKHYTEDQIVSLLLTICKERHLAQNYVNRFKNNSQLAPFFNLEDVTGELKCTLTQVLNAWKTYQIVKCKNKKIKLDKEHRINMSEKLRLDTVSNLEGYFINAFKNNMSKIYTKFKTEKRSALKQTVSLNDSSMEKHEKNSLEAATAINPMLDLEYDKTMFQIKVYLKEEDERLNAPLIRQFGSEENVPSKLKNNFAGLWEALQDPSIKKEMDKVKDRFGWTEHIFKTNREKLEQKVRMRFKIEGPELLKHVIDKAGQVYFNRDTQDKKQKELKELYQKTPVEVHTVYSMTTSKNNKKNYSVVVSLDEYREGKWVPIKSKKKSIDVSQAKNFDDAKNKLSKLAEKEIESVRVMHKKMTSVA